MDRDQAWTTTDGRDFTDERRAQMHQLALDGRLNQASVLPSISGAATIQWLHSEGFTVGDVAYGDAELAHDRLSGRAVWRLHSGSWADLVDMPYGVRKAKCEELRREREEGVTVVKGVVKPGSRRGTPTRHRPSDLQPLLDRAKALVVTIASLDDPNDGQVAEITKTVAALQAERDAAAEQLAEIDPNLALGRAVIRVHSDPRVARA